MTLTNILAIKCLYLSRILPKSLQPESDCSYLRSDLLLLLLLAKHTQLFHVWIKVNTCHCIPMTFEVPLEGWILLE